MVRVRGRKGRLGSVVALAAGCLMLLGSPAAVAGDSGTGVDNGPIAFGRWDSQLGDWSLWTARSDGSHQRRLTTMPSFMSDWRPDGSSLTFDFVDDTGVHVGIIRRNGTGFRKLTDQVGIQEVPRYSPDGRRIVYDAATQSPDEPGFHTDLWVMNADGSHQHPITSGGFDVEPQFSPDGRWIVFGRIVGATSPTDTGQYEAIYKVRANGSGLREVVAARSGLEHPRWSPDGRQITFNIAPEDSDARDAGTVYSVRPDGTELRVLRAPTRGLVFTKAVWSPDGRQMIVVCSTMMKVTHSDTPPFTVFNPGGADSLCTMTSDGRHLHQIVTGTPDQPVNLPSWGPRAG